MARSLVRPAFDPVINAAIEAACARAAEKRNELITPMHLIATLLEIPEVREHCLKRGGDPDAAWKLADSFYQEKLKPGREPVAHITLTSLLNGAEHVAPKGVKVGDLFLAFLRYGVGYDREYIELALGIKNQNRAEAESGSPPETERVAGPIRISPRFLALTRQLQEGAQHPSPWAPVLPLTEVIAAERELGTCLPDDFWAALAAGLFVFSAQGIGATPDGDPAPAKDVVKLFLAATARSQTEVGKKMVALFDRRMLGGEPDFVAIPRGTTFAERNRASVYAVSGSGTRQSPYPSFVDALSDMIRKNVFEEDLGAAVYQPSFGEVTTEEPVALPAKRVRHKKFGLGTVLTRTENGDDTKLEIAFDDGSKKVLLAKFVEDIASE